MCLDSQARELIPFDKKLYYTHHSIVDIIHFCTGVLYDNSEEENILPKHLCKPCLQQMKTAFDLKTKCIESDKYLSSILCSTVSNISPQELSGISINGASHSMEYYEESVAEDDDSTDGNINDMSMQEEETKHLTKYKGSIDKSKKQKPRNMKSGGTSTCNICNKTFTYIKSYKRHMKNHKEEAYYSEANVVPCKNDELYFYNLRNEKNYLLF